MNDLEIKLQQYCNILNNPRNLEMTKLLKDIQSNKTAYPKGSYKQVMKELNNSIKQALKEIN